MRSSSLRDVLCLSHLRWDFVFQRPQHLMSRCARTRRVFYLEEPLFGAGAPRIEVRRKDSNLHIVVPRLPQGTERPLAETIVAELVSDLVGEHGIESPVLWFYTPMALPLVREVACSVLVYDCMDELSLFENAPAELPERERQLLERADLVLTGGRSLYEAKRRLHPNVHAFPSSVDVEHFGRARARQIEPLDQRAIPHPRIGFAGVLDERLDAELLARAAALRPTSHFVLLGPVAKIDPRSLPRSGNLHYLGQKAYSELPRYMAGWDVATLPFAQNGATRFISPTKTPEYLAAGLQVVSTPIRDVVETYGERGLVTIVSTPEEFVEACDRAARRSDRSSLRDRADAFLRQTSWNSTWSAIEALVADASSRRLGEGRARAARRGSRLSDGSTALE